MLNKSQNNPRFYKFRKFLSFYKPYRLLFAADVICACITALTALALPLCIRYITSEVLINDIEDPLLLILKALFIMIGIITVQTVCGLFYDYKGHSMGAMMERDMRNELFNHCQKLPVSFFDREKTGALMSRITNDLLNLAETCHHGPEFLFISLASFIGAFIILFRIDARLTLVIFAVLPVFIIYTVFFHEKLRRAYRENREKIGELNASLEDTLSGIRIVKSFTNEGFENKKFHEANQVFCSGRINIYKNEAFYYSVMEFFFVPLVTAVVVVAGGVFISRSYLGAPDLIVFLLYISYLTSPLTRVAQQVGMYQDGIAAFNRFMEILEMKAEEISEPALREIQEARGFIEFDNVSFRYGKELENVLENISFEIKPGESIALIGSSGAGKTTLCSLIPCFYEPCAGRILLDGEDIAKMDLHTLRKNIGIVTQDVYLFNGTVTENISYGKPESAKEEIIKAAKMANAHDFIMALPKGYNTEIGQRGIRLSGGQRQRLSIARAILKDPPVIIFDEATSSIDRKSEKAIHDSIENFMKDRTVIIIAHRLSTIKKAKRILSLSEKSIEEVFSTNASQSDSLPTFLYEEDDAR
ncbi:MAG: ABC transporter ATP-binding protein/permease [Treponema sp.]|jgi:ATP-binding cassette subfamily B protein|nr:ABC transporter ATP-binding protein/permease [Treponema sp.]